MTEPGNRHGTVDEIDAAAQDWFLRAGAGGLSAEEHACFEAWRNADPRHFAAYEELRSLWAEIGSLEPAFAPQGRERPAEPPPQQHRLRPAWWRTGSVVTGLAAACLLLFVFGPATSRLPARLLADHSTATGEQRMVSLPDGSIAWLNTDSAIDIAYTPERRRVKLLQGEALFEVQKDAARPFDVVAAEGRTTAVGTAFAVKEAGEGATVTVTEGIVRVTSPDTSGLAPADTGALVEAGQQVTYRRGEAPGIVRPLDAAATTAWRHGSIVIRGRPLAEALAEIGRYRGGRIVLMGNASRYGAVTARLALADLDGGIDAIAATHGLTVTRVTNYLMIIR